VEIEAYVQLMPRSLSLVEFRRDAKRALDAVCRGERIVLTYRGRPVARLEPVRPKARVIPENDPFLRIEDFAVDGPGERLPNDDIDSLLYRPNRRPRPARQA
jgi:prevent-host-death family protein